MPQANLTGKKPSDAIARVNTIRRVFRTIKEKAKSLTRKTTEHKESETIEAIRKKISV